MNFFESQEQARKKTSLLILYFILAILLTVISINLIIIGTIVYFNPDRYLALQFGATTINTNTLYHLILQVSTIAIPIILGIILLGTISKMITLRNGGLSVAQMVNARPIDLNTKDLKERQFINVVEEMSIASGVSIPKLYVMDNEPAINAFVAGFKPQDTVMVVTKGSLDKLTRDELQGVIGHEYSHIFNSDLPLSLKLMGILAGLLIIGKIGEFFIRHIRISSRSNERSSGNGGLIIILAAIAILVVGYIGLFFGRLIKAAISRQRELLADSCSVAYTRNPAGLIGALLNITKSDTGSQLHNLHAEDISHFSFESTRDIALFKNLLATHPSIEERVNRLDPEKRIIGDIKFTPATDSKTPNTNDAVAQFSSSSAALLGNSIGHITDKHILYAKIIIEKIPKNIITVAHDSQKVQIILYALTLININITEHEKNAMLGFINPTDYDDILLFKTQIGQLYSPEIIAIIDIAMPAFKLNALKQKKLIATNIDNIIKLTPYDLFQFTLRIIIGKTIEINKSKTLYYNFDEVLPEISTIIYFLISKGNPLNTVWDAEYQQRIRKFTANAPLPPNLSEINLTHIDNALAKLNLLRPFCKEVLIKESLDIIESENKINFEEAQLIRAISAALDCPIPPILPN